MELHSAIAAQADVTTESEPSDGLTWFGAIIPRRSVAFGSRSIDFGARWDEYTALLDEQVNREVYRPTLNTEHGTESQTVKPKVFGVVERIVALTVEDLAARGITADVDGVYVGVRPSYEGALDGVEYVSFGIYLDFTEPVTGRTWPIWLDEVTAVDRPHIRVGQQPASELKRIGFTAAAAAQTPAEEGNMEEMDALKAEVQRLTALCEERDARIVELEEALDASGAKMEAQAVESAIAAGVDPSMRDVLVATHRGDDTEGRTQFHALVTKLTAAPEPAGQTGFAAAAQASIGDRAGEDGVPAEPPRDLTIAERNRIYEAKRKGGASITMARTFAAQATVKDLETIHG